MKHKISLTVDTEMIKYIDSLVKTARFRNRSHGFEYCVKIVKDRKCL